MLGNALIRFLRTFHANTVQLLTRKTSFHSESVFFFIATVVYTIHQTGYSSIKMPRRVTIKAQHSWKFCALKAPMGAELWKLNHSAFLYYSGYQSMEQRWLQNTFFVKFETHQFWFILIPLFWFFRPFSWCHFLPYKTSYFLFEWSGRNNEKRKSYWFFCKTLFWALIPSYNTAPSYFHIEAESWYVQKISRFYENRI